MHTADWSDVYQLEPEHMCALVAEAEEAIAGRRELPAQRHKALTIGYQAFWAGEAFEIPAEATARKCDALWTRGYICAHHAACRDQALPLRAADVRYGMICDRGRGRVTSVDNRGDRVIITVEPIVLAKPVGPFTKRLNDPFWVNTAPAGTLALLARGLKPDEATHDGIATWPGLEGARANPIAQEHPMPASDKPEKHDQEAAAQALGAGDRDTVGTVKWLAPAPVAEDTWTPRGPGLCHAMAEYCERGGVSHSDLAHRCRAGMGGSVIRGWISGGLPTKVPVADIAAAMGLTVRTANRLWLRQWEASAREPYVDPHAGIGSVIFRFMLDRGYSFEDMERASGVAESSLRSYISTGARAKAGVYARLASCMGDGWRLPTYGEAPVPPAGQRLMPDAADKAVRLAAFAAAKNPGGAVVGTGTIHKMTRVSSGATVTIAPEKTPEHAAQTVDQAPEVAAAPPAPERKLSAVERLVRIAEKGLIAEATAEAMIAYLIKDAKEAQAKADSASRTIALLAG